MRFTMTSISYCVSTLQRESWCREEEAITGPTQATESKDVQSVTRRQDFANGETLDNNQGGT
jgi:hypothetical protein